MPLATKSHSRPVATKALYQCQHTPSIKPTPGREAGGEEKVVEAARSLVDGSQHLLTRRGSADNTTDRKQQNVFKKSPSASLTILSKHTKGAVHTHLMGETQGTRNQPLAPLITHRSLDTGIDHHTINNCIEEGEPSPYRGATLIKNGNGSLKKSASKNVTSFVHSKYHIKTKGEHRCGRG